VIMEGRFSRRVLFLNLPETRSFVGDLPEPSK
jgi:hypothetical protein